MGEEAKGRALRAPGRFAVRTCPGERATGGMVGNRDEGFMRMAIAAARRPPTNSPNPRVGAVIVRDGTVLATGIHRGPGTAHAEALALEGIDPAGADLYVNLEPCVHHGRTPPCAPSLVSAGIRRVVVAMADPDERARGAGIRYLRDHGIGVEVGVLEAEARKLNAPYVHHRTTGRAHLTLKLAATLDGRLAAADGSARWITGPSTRARVHAARHRADAVLVGAGTVIADDPELTVREVPAERQPARVVVDAVGRVPPDARVFTMRPASDRSPTIVAVTDRAGHDAQIAYKETGADVIVLPGIDGKVDLHALLRTLGDRGILSVLCEGGPTLATELLRLDLVEILEVHYGPVLVGGPGPTLGDLGVSRLDEARRWATRSVTRSDGDAIVVVERTRV